MLLPDAVAETNALSRAGWFNLLGQITITGGINFTFTNSFACIWALATGYTFTQVNLLTTFGGE